MILAGFCVVFWAPFQTQLPCTPGTPSLQAYFKHHKCIEMCDGGHGTETMFSFLGGVTGRYEVGSKYFDKPDEFFSIIDKARSGRLRCTMKGLFV